MKRIAENHLNHWFKKKNRKPLIIRGARQVGKSTLVRQFAEKNKFDLLEYNFEKSNLKSLEKEINIKKILEELEYFTQKKINSKTLVFLDEIQDQPKMITALRYFKEERPEIPIIAAGSLLEFALTKEEVSIPVGRVEYLYLSTMTFSEFLMACGDINLLNRLQERNLPDFIHEELKEKFKEFMFVGGMPEAVKIFSEERNMNSVREVHQSILTSYRDDFHKYSTRAELTRIQKVFSMIPSIVGKKLKYSEIDPEEKSRELKRAIELLVHSKVIIPTYHSNGTQLPLEAFADHSVLKVYFLDVGLLSYLMGLRWENYSEPNLLKGVLSEQFVAQHLLYRPHQEIQPSLYYWLRDKKKAGAEVDFLVEFKSQVLPIEVKANESGHLKSLLIFLAEKKSKNSVQLSLRPYSSKKLNHEIMTEDGIKTVHCQLTSIPLYQVEFWESLL